MNQIFIKEGNAPERLSYGHHYPNRRIKHEDDDITILLKECNKIIKKYRNKYNIELFWTGKTSGNKGMNKRYNDKYKKLGMKNIIELCRVYNENLAYEIERKIVNQHKQNLYNATKGGSGGRASSGPYIIYISF